MKSNKKTAASYSVGTQIYEESINSENPVGRSE